MIVVLPAADDRPGKGGEIEVRETLTGARISLEADGLARVLHLNVPELRALADHCNRVARRVAKRPKAAT